MVKIEIKGQTLQIEEKQFERMLSLLKEKLNYEFEWAYAWQISEEDEKCYKLVYELEDLLKKDKTE
jgi:hypothetical protein